MSNRGPALQNIPMNWRTKELCIASVLSCKTRGCDLQYSLKYVPEKFREECASVYQVASSSNSPEQIRNIMKEKFEADRNNPKKQEESLTFIESYIGKFDELRDELEVLKQIVYQKQEFEEEKREMDFGFDKSKISRNFHYYKRKLWDSKGSEAVQRIRNKIKELNDAEAEFFTATHICGGNLKAKDSREYTIEKIGGTNTWDPHYNEYRPKNYSDMLEDIVQTHSFAGKIDRIDKLMNDAKMKVQLYSANLDYFTGKAREVSPKADKQVKEFFGKYVDQKYVGKKREDLEYFDSAYARRDYLKQQEERILDCDAQVNFYGVLLEKFTQLKEGKNVSSEVDVEEIKPRFSQYLEAIIKIRADGGNLAELDKMVDNFEVLADDLEVVDDRIYKEIEKYAEPSKENGLDSAEKIHSLIKRLEVVKIARDLADEKKYEQNPIYNQEKFINKAKKFYCEQVQILEHETTRLIKRIETNDLSVNADVLKHLKNLDVEKMMKQCYTGGDFNIYDMKESKIVVQNERFFIEKENQLKTILKMIEKEKGVSTQEKTQKAEVSEKETPVVQSVVEEPSVESQPKTMTDVEATIIKEEPDSSNKNKTSEPTLVENEVSSNDTQVERTESVEQSLATEESQEKQNDESEVVLEESASVEKVEEKPIVENEQSEKQAEQINNKPKLDSEPVAVKKQTGKKKTDAKTPREATLRQKFDISDEEEFDKLLVHYAQYNKTYYTATGEKKTEEEIKKRRNVNAQFKRILQHKASKEPKNENGEDFSTTIKNIENGQVFNYADLKEVAENKEACLKLFEIMASGVYEKDGQRTRLTQKQRIALASTLEIVSGMRMDMSKTKTTKKQEVSKVEQNAQME